MAKRGRGTEAQNRGPPPAQSVGSEGGRRRPGDRAGGHPKRGLERQADHAAPTAGVRREAGCRLGNGRPGGPVGRPPRGVRVGVEQRHRQDVGGGRRRLESAGFDHRAMGRVSRNDVARTIDFRKGPRADALVSLANAVAALHPMERPRMDEFGDISHTGPRVSVVGASDRTFGGTRRTSVKPGGPPVQATGPSVKPGGPSIRVAGPVALTGGPLV
jgi:hypothetical protein